MQISEKYNPQETEQKWYNYWLENNYFHSTPDNRPPYTIVIPPPNVTGILHMGHMLNNTIQDVLVRRARMQGFNALWVPGTDHASIATEAKVVAKLKSEGINKSDITRDEFLVHAWDWTHKYGGTILEQLKKLGCSCDWDRTRFTMEPKLSQQVIKSFVDLYNKGLIYRGYRMVNWDPEAKTNISDEEVKNRANYQHNNVINHLDGDSASKVSYQYGVTTLVSDKSRVIKGGSWNDRAYWLSPGTRRFMQEDQAASTVGFRCAQTYLGPPEGPGFKEGNIFGKRKQNKRKKK